LKPSASAAVDWDPERTRSDDAAGTAGELRCLWSRGFLAGRPALLSSFGLPAEAEDAAVVEACVARHGFEEAAQRLGGACAWIVEDRRRRRLWACRDRLGLEPLYFARAGNRVVLDASATATAVAAGVPAEPDATAVAAHLHGRFPPPCHSYLRGVSAVPPAHLLEFHRSGEELRRYWSPGEGRPAIPRAAVADELAEALLAVVGESMPAGHFALTLSSGLDSGTLALLWRRLHPDAELDAVLWSAPELPAADETRLAQRVVETLALRSHRLRADRCWPLSSTGMPLTGPDSPFVPFYAEVWEETFRVTRQAGVGGLATGAGGDHLFGYGGFGAYTYVDLLVSGRWRELARQVGDHQRVSPAPLRRILDRDLLRPLAHLLLPRWRPAWRLAVPWAGPRARRLLPRLGTPWPEPAKAGPPSRRHRLAILADSGVSWLFADLGERARRHRLELRHPLLDHRLVDLAARLPPEACFRAGWYKPVLRDLVRGHLPAEVVERRGKVTPEAIFDRGLRERQVAQARELLSGMEAARRGWVDEAALRAAFERYVRVGEGGSRVWFALTLEHWLRRYF
jgi:asparagine synthase (glutamine-hydrolysing)